MNSTATPPDGSPPPGVPAQDTEDGAPEAASRTWPIIVTITVLAAVIVAAAVIALNVSRNDSSSTPEVSGESPEVSGESPEAGELTPDEPPDETEVGGATATEGTLEEDRPEGDVAVFLCDGRACPEITEDERASLEAALTDDSDVVAVVYETSAEAYERFLELFADQPLMIEAIDQDTLPPSFRVWLHDPDGADDLAARFADHAGVDEVTVMADMPAPRLEGTSPHVDEETRREAILTLPAMKIELCAGQRCPEATDDERAAIETALDEHPLVSETEFRTREDAYETLTEAFADRPEMLEMLDPDLLPEMFDVWVVDQEAWFDDPRMFDELAADLRHLDGIQYLVDGMHDLRPLFQR